jgi:hypothetical protein
MVHMPGAAVVRSRESWERLWRGFDRVGSDGTRLIRPPVPEVDFDRYMLIAVSHGGTDECGDTRYIRSIVETDQTLDVVVGPDEGGVCPAYVAPIDVVRWPRTAKPVRFLPSHPGVRVPGRSAWWDRPRYATLADSAPWARGIYLGMLARDSETPAEDLPAIASDGADSPEVVPLLMAHPRIGESPEALATLATSYGRFEVKASELLMLRHGRRLAADSATAVEILRVLIREVPRSRIGERVGRNLVRNPRVVGDSTLTYQLIHATYRKHEAVHREACRRYLARWSGWALLEGSDWWYVTIPCPDVPPSPDGRPAKPEPKPPKKRGVPH